MRLWTDTDLTTLMGLRQVEAPKMSTIIEAAIKREIVHPIELGDIEDLDAGFAHWLSTGQLSDEHKQAIFGRAISEAIRESFGCLGGHAWEVLEELGEGAMGQGPVALRCTRCETVLDIEVKS